MPPSHIGFPKVGIWVQIYPERLRNPASRASKYLSGLCCPDKQALNVSLLTPTLVAIWRSVAAVSFEYRPSAARISLESIHRGTRNVSAPFSLARDVPRQARPKAAVSLDPAKPTKNIITELSAQSGRTLEDW